MGVCSCDLSLKLRAKDQLQTLKLMRQTTKFLSSILFLLPIPYSLLPPPITIFDYNLVSALSTFSYCSNLHSNAFFCMVLNML